MGLLSRVLDKANLEPDFRETVAALSAPALVIDVGRAAVVFANDKGRAALGFTQAEALPIAIDAAMPAIRQLARMAALKNGEVGSDRLIFWTRRGVTSEVAEVRRLSQEQYLVEFEERAAPPTANGRSLPEEASSAFDSVPSPFDEIELAAEPDEALAEPLQPDDANTLKAIARAIREGRHIETRTRDKADHQAPETSSIPGDEKRPRPPPPSRPPRIRGIDSGQARHLEKLAHELKTPLSAIVAASEIMRDERLGEMGNEKYLGYSADIHDSASHALAVIEQMLTGGVANSEPAARMDEPIDLNDLARRVVSFMQPLAAEREIELLIDAEDGEPHVLADPTGVRQILLNLLTNALKFTASGGEVRVVTGYLPDGSVFLVVRDTGIGMDAGEIDLALRNDGSGAAKPRTGGGHGLGLPLVRRLVAANKAAIEIDSAPGKGTAVLVSFPKDRVAAF